MPPSSFINVIINKAQVLAVRAFTSIKVYSFGYPYLRKRIAKSDFFHKKPRKTIFSDGFIGNIGKIIRASKANSCHLLGDILTQYAENKMIQIQIDY